jgi:hypothetical protein
MLSALTWILRQHEIVRIEKRAREEVSVIKVLKMPELPEHDLRYPDMNEGFILFTVPDGYNGGKIYNVRIQGDSLQCDAWIEALNTAVTSAKVTDSKQSLFKICQVLNVKIYPPSSC